MYRRLLSWSMTASSVPLKTLSESTVYMHGEGRVGCDDDTHVLLLYLYSHWWLVWGEGVLEGLCWLAVSLAGPGVALPYSDKYQDRPMKEYWWVQDGDVGSMCGLVASARQCLSEGSPSGVVRCNEEHGGEYASWQDHLLMLSCEVCTVREE